MSEQIVPLPIDAIVSSPYQPRVHFAEEELFELAASMREQGLIHPILVRPVGSGYELIAGERRLRAARHLCWSSVPAVIRAWSDQQAAEAALIENLQREDLTVVETARAYQRLADHFGYSQSEIARRTGKSRPAVANTLRLLQLPPEVLDLLDAGEITEGHARAILALPLPSQRVEMAEWAARNGVTVRDVERKVRQVTRDPADLTLPGPPLSTRSDSRDPNTDALEETLRRHFGTRVKVQQRGGAGQITLEFYDFDDLNRILDVMGVPL
jgi:ParB family transcriptional regulator, chromosome partitioning protein